jgi:hypothetical protein
MADAPKFDPIIETRHAYFHQYHPEFVAEQKTPGSLKPAGVEVTTLL